MDVTLLLNTIRNLVDNETQVRLSPIQKGNVTFTGISIGKGNVVPVVYVERYESMFDNNYEAVARKIIEDISEAKLDFNFDASSFIWDNIKDKLILCIAPSGTNEGYVTYPYLDMELYVRVRVFDGGTFKVSKQMLDTWDGITKEMLLHAALDCSKPNYIITPMRDIMIELLTEQGIPKELVESIINEQSKEPTEQIVITNKEKVHGASAIYCKDILKSLADKHESDLRIIPSSIHEVIVVPMKNGVIFEDVTKMVQDVNSGGDVAPEDILENHAYIFHRDTTEITW